MRPLLDDWSTARDGLWRECVEKQLLKIPPADQPEDEKPTDGK
jgi:hypothetical protein